MPQYSISVYKVSKVLNTLTYKVNLQSGFAISKVNVNLAFDYNEVDTETGEVVLKTTSLDSTVDVSENANGYVLGNFDISNHSISANTVIRLTVKSVISGERELPINASYSFRFGR